MKQCSKCKGTKAMSDFTILRSSSDGMSYYCKPCTREQAQRWYYKKTPEQRSAQSRRYNLKNKYGLTEPQYSALLAKQDHRCAICGGSEGGGQWNTFAVDHCHETQQVRGLLCYMCNLAIGKLKTPDLCARAKDYLEFPPFIEQERQDP